ncbi:MAG: MerR family DNA-binding protein [Actinomycetota bacterium]|nr:MerR family DNA-binding protein [Actinomycetota bacterium]
MRFYESAGLLPPGRTAAGYRVYGEDAVERLGFITAAKRLGLPLEEIAGLLRVRADGSCAQVRDSLRPRLAARIAEAEQRAGELAAFTAALHAARDHLDALTDRDGRYDPECGFLPAEAGAMLWNLHAPDLPRGSDGASDGTVDFAVRSGLNVTVTRDAQGRPLAEHTVTAFTDALNRSPLIAVLMLLAVGGAPAGGMNPFHR